MLENENFASWLYPVTLGATSIWERWNTHTEYGPNSQTMNSYNHYAFATNVAFMMTTSAGIQRGDNGDLNRAGFSNFILQPSPGGSLNFVNASYNSIYGKIKSSWTANPDVVNNNGVSDMKSYSAVVPPNTNATLYLPLGQTINESSLDGFENIPGVTFIGLTTNNGIDVAKFELSAGGYDFKVSKGTLVASLQKGYATL